MNFKDYQKATRLTAKYHNPFEHLNEFFDANDDVITHLWNLYRGTVNYDLPPLERLMWFYRNRSVFGYLCTAMTGEMGEFQNLLKKFLRGDPKYANDDGTIPADARLEILLEMGDILWYLSEMCTELGFSMEDVAQANIDKLQGRAQEGTIKDDGRER